MRFPILVLAAALAVVACDKAPNERPATQSRADNPPATLPQVDIKTTPANLGQPGSQEEKKEGANPVQGHVDPKQADQHKDFQQRGDAAGPRGPDTAPKPGS
jgi:hypothetical protein